MFQFLDFELYSLIGHPVSAIDGYIGTVVDVRQTPDSAIQVQLEADQNFIDLHLYYVDRISAGHVMLNINKHSIFHL